MPWTNVHNIPEPLANAIMNDTYDHDPDPLHYSATELIAPTRMAILRRRYGSQVTQDVSGGLWLLLGSAVHEVISRADVQNGFSEERLETEIDGLRVSGKADLWEKTEGGGIVTDWKITSVWAFKNTDKEEWDRQVNIYAYLYRAAGFPVTDARIYAILRDWRPGELLNYGPREYPEIPFAEKTIPLWSQEMVHHFIAKRLRQLERYKEEEDQHLPLCSPDERWVREEAWAVRKIKNKRATKVFKGATGELDAQEYLEHQCKGYTTVWTIDYRPGISMRCKKYCEVCEYCNFWKENVKE